MGTKSGVLVPEVVRKCEMGIVAGIAIAIAASASFCTPIGYQTNTIVQGLGGYRFRDFVRAGLPLTAITFIVSMIFIPIFWKF